ncbi:hypothetical protein [Lysobacter soli]|uniref:hypothetical protein n=1 Tax=Lysobacter soli TaxID=453783 RepID=UPI0015F28C30|nr:hypothetical protein [Lysobacter soli]
MAAEERDTSDGWIPACAGMTAKARHDGSAVVNIAALRRYSTTITCTSTITTPPATF